MIAGTANEFPSFSFLLGDLHAHVMASPFTLLAVGYALQLALAGPPLGAGRLRAAAELVLAALALGALVAISSLDYPTALALTAGALALYLTRQGPRVPAGRTLLYGLALAALSAALYLPFTTQFSPDTHGIGLVRQHDSFLRVARDVGLIYALPLWVLLAALAHRLAMPWRWRIWIAVAATFLLVLLAPSRLAGLALLLTLAALALHAALDVRLDQPQRFFWLLLAVGVGLVAVGDFVYVRDAFDGTASFRFNTVFKAGYQAWYLLAVAAAAGVLWAPAWLRPAGRRAWLVGLALLCALLTAYPIAGSYARTGGFAASPSLDGLAWRGSAPPMTPRASPGCAATPPTTAWCSRPWGPTSTPTAPRASRPTRACRACWAGPATRCSGATTRPPASAT